MVKPGTFVVSLKNIDKDDSGIVGGKAANLGEMLSKNFSVPPGFVITSYAFDKFLEENQLQLKIKHLIGTIDFKNKELLDRTSLIIKKLIIANKISDLLLKDIFKHYKDLDKKDAYVAIRSSATQEDSKFASFAGQNETFLNVKGDAAVAHKVREAWSSLFDSRSLFYRYQNKISLLNSSISLVVQKMVESEASGIMFTADPISLKKNRIVIEAIYGLGEYIVQGRITPDYYEIDKFEVKILSKKISEQKVMLKKSGEVNRKTSVSRFKRSKQKISDIEIVELAKIGKKIEEHYYFPQDIEWAKEKNKLYVVQTRPITTLGELEMASEAVIKEKKNPIIIGTPASQGIAIGRVVFVKNKKEIGTIKSGDIIVAQFTTPDYVMAIKKSTAVLTERGGKTSHAAIISREFGKPAIVGIPKIFSKLKNGSVVTVNGKTGEVFLGNLLTKQVKTNQKIPNTATKILVNVSDALTAERASRLNVDGVGLLRAEFIMAQLGMHPKKIIEIKKQKEFIERMAEQIGSICKSFYPRPVLYRASDLKSNEYMNLDGGRLFEKKENNPMMGFRGAYRHIQDRHVFEMELKAVLEVRGKMGFNNLNLMIPFVRSVNEMMKIKKIITSMGLRRSHDFKLYMMAEVPSNVILIDKFIDTGIDGVSIGSNDLTMLLLGADRDNEEVSQEYSEMDESVICAFTQIIKACHKKNIDVSICGEAPGTNSKLVDILVKEGITSLSVSPDLVNSTRRNVYETEKSMIIKL